MGVITKRYEFPIPIAPSRMFKAMADRENSLIPKLLPDTIKGVEFTGDGGVGSTRTIYFVNGPVNYVKHRVEEIDVANNYVKFTLFETDLNDENLLSVMHEVKLEPTADGGSMAKLSNHYHTKGDYVPKDEDIQASEDQDKAIQIAIIKHLVANPGLYA